LTGVDQKCRLEKNPGGFFDWMAISDLTAFHQQDRLGRRLKGYLQSTPFHQKCRPGKKE
jgi:hypothetical protein